MKKMIRPAKQNIQGQRFQNQSRQDQCLRDQHPYHQKGMTGITMAMILVLVAFFAMLLIRLFPIYMEHFSVSSHLNSLSNESGVSEKTNAEIIDTLRKRLEIDDVKHVTSDDIFIERQKGGLVTVAIEYEVRTTAISNVDMVVSFVDEVELN